MIRKLFLYVFIFSFIEWKAHSQSGPGVSPEQLCLNAQTSCSSCLQAHPSCAWCADNSTAASSRCRTASLTEAQCTPNFVENPQGSVTDIENLPFTTIADYTQDTIDNTKITQLRPQRIDVKLRQGQPQKVNVTFRRVLDYPLDLYYVMDLSYSMRDDLQTLQSLGRNLANSIQSVTSNVRLGFGTFVDKVMMPYASTVPELVQNPCLRSQNQSCAPVFGFRHQLPLTDNGAQFQEAVSRTRISGNIDSPEGGFDALMQIAVCRSEIQWRDGALRVVVFTTDASSHIAMDGKLAAILEINDMKCHLERTTDGSYLYSESKLLDYPSIGQLKKVFEENKIQSIFAVTEEVYPLYEGLRGLLENTFVEALRKDSSNVVDIIERAYAALRSKIQLNAPTVPNNVNLKYRVLCPNEDDTWAENKLDCNTVAIGDEVVFQFELTAQECPPTANKIDTVNITSGSILDYTTLQIGYVSCECDCSSSSVENSPSCSSSGTLECGLCYCETGASGQECQCTASSTGQALEAQCTRDADTYQRGDELCSSVGTCECGKCECEENYYGASCQCRRTGCVNDCGGPDRGTCENCDNNPICECNEVKGWTLNKKIGDCSCNENLCQAPNSTLVCNGGGVCDCNECVCGSFLSGKYCNRCEHPECTGIVDGCVGPELRECAECVYDNERQDKVVATECLNVCTDRGIRFRSVDILLSCDPCTASVSQCQQCNALSPNSTIHTAEECLNTHATTGCDLSYKIFWNSDFHQFEVHVLEFNAERDCPGPVDPLLIVLPVVGGIVLLGLIALILWKIIQTIRDKHEYQQFLEDTKNSQWSKGQNPLFDSPTNRIENPAYIGN